MSSRDIQKKVSIGTLRKVNGDQSSQTVEKVAQRFNQLSKWVSVCIVSEQNIERRAQMFVNFIETAKQCLELRNYNSVMAIVVAALGSAPVRRLKDTKEKISPECLLQLNKMESLMDTKGNHKRYREALRTSPTPAVPYFGLYLKDLTFIGDGNPDYLTNGLINLSKRRQVYVLLEEIHRFQRKKYNFQKVPEVREYLFSRPYVPEDQLHQMSREIEPTHSKYPIVTSQANAPSSLDRIQSNLFRRTTTTTGKHPEGALKGKPFRLWRLNNWPTRGLSLGCSPRDGRLEDEELFMVGGDDRSLTLTKRLRIVSTKKRDRQLPLDARGLQNVFRRALQSTTTSRNHACIYIGEVPSGFVSKETATLIDNCCQQGLKIYFLNTGSNDESLTKLLTMMVNMTGGCYVEVGTNSDYVKELEEIVKDVEWVKKYAVHLADFMQAKKSQDGGTSCTLNRILEEFESRKSTCVTESSTEIRDSNRDESLSDAASSARRNNLVRKVACEHEDPVIAHPTEELEEINRNWFWLHGCYEGFDLARTRLDNVDPAIRRVPFQMTILERSFQTVFQRHPGPVEHSDESYREDEAMVVDDEAVSEHASPLSIPAVSMQYYVIRGKHSLPMEHADVSATSMQMEDDDCSNCCVSLSFLLNN
eukprot:gene18096-19905_t